VPVVYKCMIESDLLQVQIVVDHNNTPDTYLSMGQQCVMVTVAVSIDVGKLIMLNLENQKFYTLSVIINI